MNVYSLVEKFYFSKPYTNLSSYLIYGRYWNPPFEPRNIGSYLQCSNNDSCREVVTPNVPATTLWHRRLEYLLLTFLVK